jgi:hypothetical protein
VATKRDGQFIFGLENNKPVVSERLENDDAIYLLVVKENPKGSHAF